MTALQTFIDFAKTLPEDRQGELEIELASLMHRLQNQNDWKLPESQEAEIEKRFEVNDTTLANPNVIERILGRRWA